MPSKKSNTKKSRVRFPRLSQIFTTKFYEVYPDESIRSFAIETKNIGEEGRVCYDNTRKIMKGDVPPSPAILQKLCAHFDLNYDEVYQVALFERLLDRINRDWDSLTSHQKRELLEEIRVKE